MKISLEEFTVLQKRLLQKKDVWLRIVSDSMLPLLPIDTRAKIEYIPHEELKTFDLIVFYRAEELFCHFLWHRNAHDGALLTRSLKQVTRLDPPVPPEYYLGRVIGPRLSRWQKMKVILHNWYRGSL